MTDFVQSVASFVVGDIIYGFDTKLWNHKNLILEALVDLSQIIISHDNYPL